MKLSVMMLVFGAATVLTSCNSGREAPLSSGERNAIERSIRTTVVSAYDLSKPDVVASLMSLYPPEGKVVSASGGNVTTTRAELESQIRSFWTRVGRNMKNPRWEWNAMHIDVLSPRSAVMTATYGIPHSTPAGEPHTISGAWTAAFARRGGRWVIVQEHLSDVPAP